MEEFFIDTLSKTIAALVGFCGALHIFNKGIERSETRDRLAITNSELNKVNYLLALKASVVDLVKTQIEENRTFVSTLKENNTTIPYIRYVPINDIKRLSRILGDPEYFHAYINQVSGKNEQKLTDYRKLTQYSDFILVQMNQVRDMNKIKNKYNDERVFKYLALQQDLVEKMTNTAHELPPERKFEELVLFDSLSEYTKDLEANPDSLQYIHEQLPMNLYAKIMEYATTGKGEYNWFPFINIVKKMKDLYLSILGNIAKHSKEIEEITESLERVSTELDKLIPNKI